MFNREYKELRKRVQKQISELKRLSKAMYSTDKFGNVVPNEGVTKEELEKAIVIASEIKSNYEKVDASIKSLKTQEKVHASEVAGTRNLMLSMEKDGFEFPEYMRKTWRL